MKNAKNYKIKFIGTQFGIFVKKAIYFMYSKLKTMNDL